MEIPGLDKLAPWEAMLKRILFSQLGPIKNKKILDFGSGTGFTANYFAQNNEVIAVEPSKELINSRCCDFEYQQLSGSVERLQEFEDASFDLIFCHNVLEYAEELEEIVKEFYRLLNPAGTLSIVKHNRRGRVMQTVVLLNDFEKAHELLDGKNSTASKFGTICYYEDTDLTDWQDKMIEMELRAAQIEEYRAKAFFHHLILKKGVEKEWGKTMNYQDINARTIDQWVAAGWEWGKPISHEIYEKAEHGEWDVLLTPTKPVPHAWFGELRGKKVLGLASGGGQQMPIFAALGAECTVLDYSEKQLESERILAEQEGYSIRIIRADMTKPLPFTDGEFDLIFHPVSNCYVEEVKPIFKECFRILKKGGVLLAGLDNGMNFIYDEDEIEIRNVLPFNPLKNPEQMKKLEAENGGVQFSHTLEEQIGGQLEAGFRLTHVYEDTNGCGNLHEHNIPSFWATRAVKE